MKKLFTILFLLSLTLLPIIWNGVGLFHYVVEHTHTFCLDDTEHHHTTTDDCLSICQFSPSHHHHQVLVQKDYQELKLYIRPQLFFKLQYNSFSTSSHFFKPSFWENSFSEDIFHPPIA